MKGNFSLIFCLSFALMIVAGMDCIAQEEDHSEYYNAAVRLLDEGDCIRAEQNYNTYKELSGKSSSIIERGIKDCKGSSALQMQDDISPLYVDKAKVYRNGKEIPESQLRNMFANTESYDMYDRGINNYKNGKKALWAGLALFVSGSLCQLGWLEPDADWDTIGGGFSIAGIALGGIAYCTAYGGMLSIFCTDGKVKKAVDEYNKSKNKKDISFNFGYTGNGLCLGLTF